MASVSKRLKAMSERPILFSLLCALPLQVERRHQRLLTGHRSATAVIDGTAVSSGEVNDVKFDPLNGNRLASASDDETIKLWDLSSGTCQATLQGHR